MNFNLLMIVIQSVMCNFRRVIIIWINKLNLNTMKQMLIPMLLFLMHFSSYSQKLDLIVTARGDSVACKIDSITESQIFFQMKIVNWFTKFHYQRFNMIENFLLDFMIQSMSIFYMKRI